MNKQITLCVSAQEVQVIVTALQNMPHKAVAELIPRIVSEANNQLKPLPKEENG